MSRMRKIVAVVLIDSLRHDFITSEHTPFLFSLAERGISGVIAPQLSFSLHPAWFGGLYPNESGKWGYYYSPETSPYRFIKPICVLTPRTDTLRKICNLAIGKVFRLRETLAPYLPLDYACYFDFEKKTPWNPNYLPHVTLFDMLRKHGLKWLFIGAPGNDVGTHMVLTKFRKEISADISFLWLHFGELDWACHEFGPNSYEVKRSLHIIDWSVRSVFRKLNDIFKEIDLLVFGDHGSVEVKSAVDIEARLRSAKLKPCRDYLYFLGATMARFWFRKENARAIIETMLNKLGCGKALEEPELIRYGCKFNDLRYGEFVWVAHEGTVISPNFYNGSTIPKGMHGYLPEVVNDQSSFLLLSPSVSRVKLHAPVELVDMFPTLLDLLSLSVPKGCNGTSILKQLYSDQSIDRQKNNVFNKES